jgi:hypothetical protein
LKQDVSKLYRYLTLLEKEPYKLLAMHDRRRELLEDLLNDIKGLEVSGLQMVEIYAELTEIAETIFNLRYGEIKTTKTAPKKAEIDSMNSIGLKSIDYATRALATLDTNSGEYLNSIVSLTLTTARIYSKLFDKDPAIQASYLEKSVAQYKEAKAAATKEKN